MKSIFLKISGWGLIISFLFFGVRAWDNITKWNVSTDPIQMSIADMSANTETNRYVTLTGGMLDLTNAYEESLTTKSDAKLTSNYYIPVLSADSTLAYVLKKSIAPTLADLTEQVTALGLLENDSGLSDEMSTEFTQKYATPQGIFVLDETYKSQTRFERLKGLLYPFIFILVFVFIRIAVIRSIEPRMVEPEKSGEPESQPKE